MARNACRFFLLTLLMAIYSGIYHFSYAATNDASIKVKWSYHGNEGPSHWGQLSPAFSLCSKGLRQSPVNIPASAKLVASALKIDYQAAPLSIIDDGVTDLSLGKEQTIYSNGHSIQVNFSGRTIKESIMIGDQPYHLVQLHFHTPSENKWHNQSFPMEIHFVHQGLDGSAAVVAVFVKKGEANPVLNTVVRHLPTEEGKEYYLEKELINPAGLLPAKQAYYQFNGSLTTPPCAEGVTWLVMEAPITASDDQINLLRKAAGGENARPIQPLNKREVTFHA